MQKKYLIGILFKALNCLIFPLLSLQIVYCAQYLSIHEVFCIRGFLGSIFCMVLIKLSGENIFISIDNKNKLFYLARSALSIIAMYLWTIAVQNIGLNDATVLSYTAPILLTLSAKVFFKEKLKLINFIMILIGLTGIIIIIKPNFDNANFYGLGAAFLSIIFWVTYEIVCKKQTASQNYLNQNLYTSFLSILLILPFTKLNITASIFDTKLMLMLVLVSLMGLINVSSIFLAYSFTPMSILAPFTFLRLVLTCLVTYFLYQTTLTNNFIIGASLILVTNSYFLYDSLKSNNT